MGHQIDMVSRVKRLPPSLWDAVGSGRGGFLPCACEARSRVAVAGCRYPDPSARMTSSSWKIIGLADVPTNLRKDRT